MAKRITALFALLMLIHAQFALAANQKPPDVPTPVIQPITYQAGTTKNLLGNGTATAPDTPPWYASMPSDIPTASRTNWLLTGTNTGSNYIDCSNLAVTCEAKFRSFLNDSHILYDDPIRNYGEPGTSHCHNFFGNDATNAFSTYATLRARNESHAGGGRLNATGYWAPCLILTSPFSDGKNYAMRNATIGLYYLADNSVSQWLVSLPTGLRYVGGTNMDDPEDTARKRAVIVGNAQTGTSGRYSYRSNGYAGIQCLIDGTNSGAVDTTLSGAQTYTGTQYVPYLNSTTGQNVSDPFLGNCKTNTTTGTPAIILFDFVGPDCWDGVNPWVPGGYDHVINSVGDTQLNASRIQFACPNHWYHIPAIQIKVQFTVTGWADYQRMRLSSDDAMQAKLNSLPTCTTDATGAYSNAPCATHSGPLWNGSSYSVPNGASFHTDWMMGWDGLTLKTWEANCLGVRNLYDGNGNINTTTGTAISSTPHTCENSIISSTLGMKQDLPPDGSHNPIVHPSAVNYPSTSAGNMRQIRTTNPSGMGTYHVH
jgi:hypothetical protein